MSLKHLAVRLPSTAVWAVTHPVQSAGRAVGIAKGVVVGGIGLVEVLRTPAQEPEPARATTPEPAEAPGPPAATGPQRVVPPPSPEPPAEPPIDVVGEALAKEQSGERLLLGGTQGEPHPVTRDEAHGEAPLVREEREEIEEETWEALEDEAR